MYRDTRLAAATQIDALRGDLAALTLDLEAARRARADALAQIERIREGVEVDPALESDPRYRWALRGLRGFAALSALAMLVGLVPLLSAIIEQPMLSAQGVENFVFHVRHGRGLIGLAAAGFVVVAASPWILVPWLSARGLAGHRRWGWTLGVVACGLFLPTPLLPVAIAGLVVLLSSRVRNAYFARG